MMHIRLKKAAAADCRAIHEMQVRAFAPLLEKYRDFSTNPGAEGLERIEQRMAQPFTDYYLIRPDDENGESIGAMRVVRLQNGVRRISPMFILPQFHGKGYAQQAIRAAEALYPDARLWELDTIKQEAKLCHLYEKMGYVPTGEEKDIQPGMTIVFYEKHI